MTLSSTTVKVSYDGDDATVAFATTFVYWDDTDIKAIVRTDSSGAETTLVDGTHYNLSGGSGAVGTLTTTAGNTVATGETLIIKSNRDDTQGTAFPAGGPFPSANTEQAIDQATRLIQQRSEEVGRALVFSETSPDSSVTFPDITGNADKIIQINSAGTGLNAVTFASLSGSELTTPVTLANGGTGADLSSPTAKTYFRINSGGSAGELISKIATVADLFAKGSDVASADPLVIPTDGGYFDVTGTTTFDAQTVAVGRLYMLQFDGALTMTDDADHDLGGTSITTAAGDRAIFYAVAENTAQLVAYLSEGGQPANKIPSQATQSAIEAETNEDTYIPPDLLKNSPGVSKIWASVDRSAGTPTLNSPSHNMTSVTDDGAGQTIVTIATDFSTAVYVPLASALDSTARLAAIHTLAVGSFKVLTTDSNASAADTIDFVCAALGDQA